MMRTEDSFAMKSSKLFVVRWFTFSWPSMSAHWSSGGGGAGASAALGFKGSLMNLRKSASWWHKTTKNV